MAGISFEEYVNAYYGGTLGISKRYGIRKDDLIDSSNPAGAYNTMFGAKVFNQLNTKSEVFKLLKKEAWTQSGWRVLTQRHAQTNGVGEGGLFPDTDHPEITEVTATLKEIVTAFEMTSKAEILAEADDGLGNLAAFMRKENGEAHAFAIDQMLLADADVVTVQSAKNFETLDRVTMSDAAAQALMTRTDIDMYGLTRQNESWADATVVHNSGTDRALELNMIDTLIQGALENGVNYDDLILLTGHDTYQNLKQLMQVQGHNAGTANYRYDLAQGQAGNLNGVRGEGGIAFDSRVGSYDGIPIFISQHVAKDTTSRIHLLDMSQFAMRMAAPTTYVDNTNLAIRQKLSREYAFITAGELIVYKFNTSGSIRDLNA